MVIFGIRFTILVSLITIFVCWRIFFSIVLSELCTRPGKYPDGWFDPS
jgi:hypothetical protein